MRPQGVDLGMQVRPRMAQLEQVIGQFLRHLLGQCGDQDPSLRLRPQLDLVHGQIIDLPLGRLDITVGSINPVGRIPSRTTSRRPWSSRSCRAGPQVHLCPSVRRTPSTFIAVSMAEAAGSPWSTQGALARHVALVHAARLADRHVRSSMTSKSLGDSRIRLSARCRAHDRPKYAAIVLDPEQKPTDAIISCRSCWAHAHRWASSAWSARRLRPSRASSSASMPRSAPVHPLGSRGRSGCAGKTKNLFDLAHDSPGERGAG